MFLESDVYDGKTLLEVKANDKDWNHSLYFLSEKSVLSGSSLGMEFADMHGLDVKDETRVLFFDVKLGRFETCRSEDLEKGMCGVYRAAIGDAVVFESSLLHRSGESLFPRIGVSIKVRGFFVCVFFFFFFFFLLK